MFFRKRSTQAEYFDQPLSSVAEAAERYGELNRLNHVFRFAQPFKDFLPDFVGKKNCSKLTLLDLGAGDGTLGEELKSWAAQRGWQWQFTNVDADSMALQLSKNSANVTANILALPFAENSFDVVIASQVTHHLTTDADVLRHFREAWRVARRGVFISDLHRGALLYAMLRVTAPLLRMSPEIKADALLSVRRGFRLDEWRRLATGAGISNARVWLYYGTRILLAAKKT